MKTNTFHSYLGKYEVTKSEVPAQAVSILVPDPTAVLPPSDSTRDISQELVRVTMTSLRRLQLAKLCGSHISNKNVEQHQRTKM
jgi:hypothetical protein